MTLAEEFEAAARELRNMILSEESIDRAADLLDRAAELARDQERVVQSIVKREVT